VRKAIYAHSYIRPYVEHALNEVHAKTQDGRFYTPDVMAAVMGSPILRHRIAGFTDIAVLAHQLPPGPARSNTHSPKKSLITCTPKHRTGASTRTKSSSTAPLPRYVKYTACDVRAPHDIGINAMTALSIIVRQRLILPADLSPGPRRSMEQLVNLPNPAYAISETSSTRRQGRERHGLHDEQASRTKRPLGWFRSVTTMVKRDLSAPVSQCDQGHLRRDRWRRSTFPACRQANCDTHFGESSK